MVFSTGAHKTDEISLVSKNANQRGMVKSRQSTEAQKEGRVCVWGGEGRWRTDIASREE